MKKIAAALAAIVAVLGFTAVPAQADDSGELPGCWTTLWGVGPNWSWSTGPGGMGGGYAWSPKGQVPYGTACEDINVSNGDHGNGGFYRVRFYPSSGGNYANSWKSAPCAQRWCYVPAATNVADGTWFRIEWYYETICCTGYGDERFDIWI